MRVRFSWSCPSCHWSPPRDGDQQPDLCGCCFLLVPRSEGTGLLFLPDCCSSCQQNSALQEADLTSGHLGMVAALLHLLPACVCFVLLFPVSPPGVIPSGRGSLGAGISCCSPAHISGCCLLHGRFAMNSSMIKSHLLFTSV